MSHLKFLLFQRTFYEVQIVRKSFHIKQRIIHNLLAGIENKITKIRETHFFNFHCSKKGLFSTFMIQVPFTTVLPSQSIGENVSIDCHLVVDPTCSCVTR
jgi:hypothetical protein